jgi:hypothetical protein
MKHRTIEAAAYVIPMVTNEKQNITANINPKYIIPARTNSIIPCPSNFVARLLIEQYACQKPPIEGNKILTICNIGINLKAAEKHPPVPECRRIPV